MDILGPRTDRAIERIALTVAVIGIYLMVVIEIGRGWLW